MSKTILHRPPDENPEKRRSRTDTDRWYKKHLQELATRVIPAHRIFALADYMENRDSRLCLNRQTYAELAQRGWRRAEVNRTIALMAADDAIIECGWDDGVVIFRLVKPPDGVSWEGDDAVCITPRSQ